MIVGLHGNTGHTFPELATMLAIVAILAAAAVPAFSGLLMESRMNAAVTTVMHAVNLARQFSATRGDTIHLCGSDDSRSCSGRTDWTGELLLSDATGAFHHSLALANGDGVPVIRSNRATVQFEGGSGFATPATLTLCDRRGPHDARAVIINRSGRPRVSVQAASDAALTC